MTITPRFMRRNKPVEVDYSISMNLAPVGKLTNENRISIIFQKSEGENVDSKTLRVDMSKSEALRLGRLLVDYGNTPILKEREIHT